MTEASVTFSVLLGTHFVKKYINITAIMKVNWKAMRSVLLQAECLQLKWTMWIWRNPRTWDYETRNSLNDDCIKIVIVHKTSGNLRLIVGTAKNSNCSLNVCSCHNCHLIPHFSFSCQSHHFSVAQIRRPRTDNPIITGNPNSTLFANVFSDLCSLPLGWQRSLRIASS